MQKIILAIFLSMSLQGFVAMEKYTDQNTTKKCSYIKDNAIKYAKKAKEANSYEQAMQYKNIADNLFEQNIGCTKGNKQRTFGSPAQFK